PAPPGPAGRGDDAVGSPATRCGRLAHSHGGGVFVGSRSRKGLTAKTQRREGFKGGCRSNQLLDADQQPTLKPFASWRLCGYGFVPATSASSRHFQKQSTSSKPTCRSQPRWVSRLTSWLAGSSFSTDEPSAV